MILGVSFFLDTGDTQAYAQNQSGALKLVGDACDPLGVFKKGEAMKISTYVSLLWVGVALALSVHVSVLGFARSCDESKRLIVKTA